ncbi:MAG: hypothetical protein HC903_19035 [Methylacidiphilales bacterium]|nr:hypothetical protein [Candidatus Methylacidiphilales bacterium]NJR17125.1 hypothetical protein [Calothrix sp. CSU_2_0]
MAKPVGYFGVPHDNALIVDMTDTWGQDLSRLDNGSKLWLVAQMANYLLKSDYYQGELAENCPEVITRLQELELYQIESLIQCLAA